LTDRHACVDERSRIERNPYDTPTLRLTSVAEAGASYECWGAAQCRSDDERLLALALVDNALGELVSGGVRHRWERAPTNVCELGACKTHELVGIGGAVRTVEPCLPVRSG
jgi:hypothetical protein